VDPFTKEKQKFYKRKIGDTKMEIHWIWIIFATLLGCYNFADKIVRNLNEWYYDFKLRKREHMHPLPPGDMGWPIIGNMWPFFKHFSSGHPDEFVNDIVLKSLSFSPYFFPFSFSLTFFFL